MKTLKFTNVLLLLLVVLAVGSVGYKICSDNKTKKEEDNKTEEKKDK